MLPRTTPFDKSLIMFIKEGQLRLVFIVPAIDVSHRSLPPPPSPPYLIAIGFPTVSLSRVYADFQDISMGTLQKLILISLRAKKMGS